LVEQALTTGAEFRGFHCASAAHAITLGICQCPPDPPVNRRVLTARALEPEDARGEEAVAPGAGRVEVVLEHGGAELVIMRIRPAREDQPARGGDERLRAFTRMRLHQGKRLAGGGLLVAADVGADLLDGDGYLRGHVAALERVDADVVADVAAAAHRLAEGRQERRRLQEDVAAWFIAPPCLIP